MPSKITKIDWDSPVTKKHTKEAEKFGLVLIDLGKKINIGSIVLMIAVMSKRLEQVMYERIFSSAISVKKRLEISLAMSIY